MNNHGDRRKDHAFHIYLSHASGDFLLVERIWRILESIGLRAYMYEHYTHPGRCARDAVLETLKDSAEVVCFLTESGAGSAWVHQELGAIQAMAKPLVPWIQTDGPQAPGFALLENPILYDPRKPDHAIAELIWLVRHDFELFEGPMTVDCPSCKNFAQLDLPGMEQASNAMQRNEILGPHQCPRCLGLIYLSPWTFEPLAEQLALSRAWAE
jgi:hypothetical protein